MLKMMKMPKIQGELAVAWNVGGKEDQEGDEGLTRLLTRSAMAAALAAREPTAEKRADMPENAARVVAELRSTIVEKDEQLRKMSQEFGVQLLTKEQEGAKALAAQAEAAHEARVAHLQQAAAKRLRACTSPCAP